MSFNYPDYCCPRCSYHTKEKTNMKNHFYKKKKPCPSITSDIDLTEEIKQYVLGNRVYNQSQSNFESRILNANLYKNNYVASLPIKPKLDTILNYKNNTLQTLSDSIEDKYRKEHDQYENKDGMNYSSNDLISTVGKAVKSENIEHFNMLHDDQQLWINKDDNLTDVDLHSGIKEILDAIHSTHWYVYECYLVNKYWYSQNDSQTKMKYREHLTDFYKFLISLDLESCTKDKTDYFILDGQNIDKYCTDACDDCMDIYKKTKNNMKNVEMSKIKSQCKTSIINTCKANTKKLNATVIDLMKIDQDFKAKLFLL